MKPTRTMIALAALAAFVMATAAVPAPPASAGTVYNFNKPAQHPRKAAKAKPRRQKPSSGVMGNLSPACFIPAGVGMLVCSGIIKARTNGG